MFQQAKTVSVYNDGRFRGPTKIFKKIIYFEKIISLFRGRFRMMQEQQQKNRLKRHQFVGNLMDGV